MDYKIVKEKIVFEKDGVYFSLTELELNEFMRLAYQARLQLIRKESREEIEEHLHQIEIRSQYGMFS